MKQIRMLQAIAVLATLNFVSGSDLNTSLASTRRGNQVSGVVTDTNEARVANATVMFTTGRAAQSVTTSEDGTYSIDLPAGIYRIAVKSRGFCVARRAAFRVEALDTVKLDFTLILCPIVNTLRRENGDYKDETDAYQPPFKEDEVQVGPSTAALRLFIQYGHRAITGRITQYEGFRISGGKLVGVTASYNLLTIYADRVWFDRKALRLEARGNMILDTGQQRVLGQRVEITFRAGKPVIEHIS